jgi:hypothetical protein
MAMQARSCRSSSKWIMAMDYSDSSLLQYIILKADSSNASFSQCIILPSFMNNVSAAIHQKSILCSFTHDILLVQIGELVNRFSEARLKRIYTSAEAFEDDCILFVLRIYIKAVLDDLEADENKMLPGEEYYALLSECKMQWLQKRERRRRDEIYLGKPSFPNELRRCLDEFSKTAIQHLGFNIIMLQDVALKYCRVPTSWLRFMI